MEYMLYDLALQKWLLGQQREKTLATQYIESEKKGKYKDVKDALYKFYKNYKLKSDETKINDLEKKLNTGQIKCNKNDLESLFDVLAEENEGIGNCAVTAMAMTYYNTLSSDDINRNHKELEEYIFRKDDEANRFCNMEEFRFNMFIYRNLWELEGNNNSELNGIKKKFGELYYEFTRGFSEDFYYYSNKNPNPRNKFYYQEFSKYVRNQIVAAFKKVAKKNNELHKNGNIDPHDEQTVRINDDAILSTLQATQRGDIRYSDEAQVNINIQELCTNKVFIETDHVGIGLSRIAEKPVFILTLIIEKFKNSEGEPKLFLKVSDAKKIEDKTYGHRFNFTFSSDPKAKMRKEEIQLASNYLDLLSNCENKNPVLFYYGDHYTYLDPNNKRKRELFSKCMKKLILDRYIKEANKEKVGSNLNNNLNPNQDNIKNQFEDKSKNSNGEKTDVVEKNVDDNNIKMVGGNKVSLKKFKLSNLRLEVLILYGKYRALRDRVKESQNELEKIKKQLTEKQNNSKEQTSQMEENTRKIKKQEDDIFCYEKSAIEHKTKIEKMEQEKNKLESQIEENTRQIKKQEDEISQCENDVKKQLDKMEINNKNAVMLEKEIATQEENHKAENKEEAKLFFRSPEFTDAKKSKFSITYFLAWIFCKLSDGFKNYVNQTRTIIDLDQKFNDLRLNIQNEGDTKDIASQICNTLDDFLLTCDDANLLKKYDVIYCYLLDLHECDMPSICKKLDGNQSNSNYQLFNQNCKGLLSKIEVSRKSKNNDEESIISVKEETNNNNNPLLFKYTSENIQK